MECGGPVEQVGSCPPQNSFSWLLLPPGVSWQILSKTSFAWAALRQCSHPFKNMTPLLYQRQAQLSRGLKCFAPHKISLVKTICRFVSAGYLASFLAASLFVFDVRSCVVEILRMDCKCSTVQRHYCRHWKQLLATKQPTDLIKWFRTGRSHILPGWGFGCQRLH